MDDPFASHAPLEVWCIDVGGLAGQETRLGSVLDDDERDRASRFMRPEDALGYRVAHGALRTILGRRLGCAPRQVRFAAGEHGKPRLRDGGPCFSLSHSGALALVAVSADGEVGVDVETLRPIPAAAALARRFFSREQARTIAEKPPSSRDREFMRSWTAMEAILKAEGTGLTAGVDRDAGPDRAHAPSAGPERAPAASAGPTVWSVRELDLAPTHVGAVAARGGGFTLRMRRFE